MSISTTTISAREVVNDLVPKLNAVEKQIKLTISAVVEASGTAPEKKERYAKLKAEFQLELTMIRMNLEHLLKRYRNELEAAMNDPRKDMLLTLDAYEATAVENAKQLYRRVQALQTQEPARQQKTTSTSLMSYKK
jgi:ABC-type phosphate transport system auxiliary subunit